MGSSSSLGRQCCCYQRNRANMPSTRRNPRRRVPPDSQSTSLEESAFGCYCFVGGASGSKYEGMGGVQRICSSWRRSASPSWRKQKDLLEAVEQQENSFAETTEGGQSNTPFVLLVCVSADIEVVLRRDERQKREKPFPIRLRDELED